MPHNDIQYSLPQEPEQPPAAPAAPATNPQEQAVYQELIRLLNTPSQGAPPVPELGALGKLALLLGAAGARSPDVRNAMFQQVQQQAAVPQLKAAQAEQQRGQRVQELGALLGLMQGQEDRKAQAESAARKEARDERRVRATEAGVVVDIAAEERIREEADQDLQDKIKGLQSHFQTLPVRAESQKVNAEFVAASLESLVDSPVARAIATKLRIQSAQLDATLGAALEGEPTQELVKRLDSEIAALKDSADTGMGFLSSIEEKKLFNEIKAAMGRPKRPLPASAASNIAELQAGLDNIKDAEEKFVEYGKPTNPLLAVRPWPLSAQAVAFDAVLTKVKAPIRRALFGTALTATEKADAMGLFPDLYSRDVVVESAFEELKLMLQSDLNNKIRAFDLAGYDVSKFMDPANMPHPGDTPGTVPIFELPDGRQVYQGQPTPDNPSGLYVDE